MRKFLLILLSFLLITTHIYSQNRITFNFGYGYFLYNSENSMKIMGDKKFDSHLSYGVRFLRKDILGLDISLGYSFSESVKKRTLIFYRTDPNSPTIVDSYGSDVTLLTHTIELNYYTQITSYLSAGIGPTFLFANRILEANFPGEGAKFNIYDKLASACIGGNVFVEFTIPLNDAENYFFLSPKLKAVYAHSFWFDEKGRILDNYKQEFLDTQISVGVGYNF